MLLQQKFMLKNKNLFAVNKQLQFFHLISDFHLTLRSAHISDNQIVYVLFAVCYFVVTVFSLFSPW